MYNSLLPGITSLSPSAWRSQQRLFMASSWAPNPIIGDWPLTAVN